VYTKKFFMAALIFLFIVATLVTFTPEQLDEIATHNNEPFLMCVVRLITEIATGELVISEDGKYLHYKK